MPVLFPYLVGGAIAYILFFKKQKPCPANEPCPDAAPCVCPACNGQGAVVLTDDSGASCGNAACLSCAGTGQTYNPELNDAGRYDAAPPMQVNVCGVFTDARAGDMDSRALLDTMKAQGTVTDAMLASCLTSPALSTQPSTVIADGRPGSVLGSDAVMETRTAGGMTVLTAMNAVSPVLPGFGDVALRPSVTACELVRAASGNNREAAGQLRTMLDNGMVRLTDLDRCNLGLSVSDQLRVTKMVTL
jgi:hypothetical protein